MKDEQYKTADLWIASYLAARNHKVLGLDTSSLASIKFIFEGGVEEDVNDFWSGARIEALRFAVEYKKLKRKLMEKKYNDRRKDNHN